MKIVVLGGGIGGLCTAIALEKNGFEVSLMEAADAFKPVGAGLSLSPNALNALAILGVLEAVMKKGNPYSSGSMKLQNGKTLTKMNLEHIKKMVGGDFLSIHRHELHAVLAKQLKTTKVFFNKRCTSLEKKATKIILHFQDESSEDADILIAADGIHSTVRKFFLPNSVERYSGQICWRGVCNKGVLPIDGISESWGKGVRFGIVPLKDNRIYWFAVMDAEQKEVKKTKTKGDIQELFSSFHFPVGNIIEQTPEEAIFQNDLNDLLPIRQFAFENALLIGDAAHATTPNMGQGACMAIEDAAMLCHLLKNNRNFGVVFKEFERKRIERTTKIVNLSYRFGKVSQTKNRLLIILRNTLMRIMPDSMNSSMYKFLFGYKIG